MVQLIWGADNNIKSELQNRIDVSIKRIKQFCPNEGYYVAFSGGKDSQLIYHLCKQAGVKFDAHYNVTTVDPPELIMFIKRNYPDVIFEYPETTMWKLIVKKCMPPTRLIRYCCSTLKEGGGIGRFVVTGVRWAESTRRKKTRTAFEIFRSSKHLRRNTNDNDDARMMFENCIKRGKYILNPIIDWKDNEVWEYLKANNIEYCELYDQGYSRLGCIGCPMSGHHGMEKDFKKWPKFYDAYIRTFEKMLIERDKKGMATRWKNAKEVMEWWMSGRSEKK